MKDLAFIDVGRIGYREGYELQQRLHAQVLSGAAPPTVLLLEHDPVITVTRRDSAARHLLATPELLKHHGIAVAETDRGGDITYHGPGQLVAYPIVPLGPLGLNVRRYVAALEDAVIDTLAMFGVTGRRDPAGIGVWVDEERLAACGLRLAVPNMPLLLKPQASSLGPQASPSKIAAIGVRIRRWVTLHGLALNVTTNLDHFRLIVPCGLSRPVTSLQQLLGDGCPALDSVKAELAESLRSRLAPARDDHA